MDSSYSQERIIIIGGEMRLYTLMIVAFSNTRNQLNSSSDVHEGILINELLVVCNSFDFYI